MARNFDVVVIGAGRVHGCPESSAARTFGCIG